jgi:TPR repeat protein
MALVCLCTGAFAAGTAQDETFTQIEPGADVLNPDKLIPLLDRGDVRAMNNIGLLWARGIGVPAPDFKEAQRWWKEAARRGYVVSMNNLGLLYANGQGVEQDYGAALKWWMMAAERGNAWAMNSVGDLYEHGQGVKQSYSEAFAWYQKAADAGDGLAMYNLGALYEGGQGVEQNYKAAYDWYNRSADKGTGSAMYNLGRMLEAGRGLPADKAEAYAWLTLAQRYFTSEDAGEAKANEEALKRLAPSLADVERQRAQELIQNLGERIEARRKTAPLKAGPGESET